MAWAPLMHPCPCTPVHKFSSATQKTTHWIGNNENLFSFSAKSGSAASISRMAREDHVVDASSSTRSEALDDLSDRASSKEDAEALSGQRRSPRPDAGVLSGVLGPIPRQPNPLITPSTSVSAFMVSPLGRRDSANRGTDVSAETSSDVDTQDIAEEVRRRLCWRLDVLCVQCVNFILCGNPPCTEFDSR